MIIGINLLNYTSSLAGNGTFAKRLLNKLQEIDRKNKYILYFNEIKDIERVFNIYAPNFEVKKINLGNRILRIKFEATTFGKILEKDKIEVYYSPSMVVSSNCKCKKIICTIHDLSPFFTKKYSSIRMFYYKTMCKNAVKNADKIITVSQNSKEDIKNILKCDEKRIEVVYNFLDDRDPPKNDNTFEKFFLFVGTIQPGKNIVRMIKAFEKFQANLDADFRLKIAGKKGWQDKDINDLIERNKGIDVLGYVSDQELDTLFSKAFSLLYPSLYEGFGIPPLECMRRECPVIVSNISSIPEVVDEFGVYVDPYSVDSIFNGMKEMYENRNAYKENLYQQSLKFNGDVEVKKLLKLFNE